MGRQKRSLDVIVIDSWATFQKVVAGPKYRGWAFRGHSDARWPLYSTISRYLMDYRVHEKAWARQERRILTIFQRKAHLFLEHVPDQADTFQWLALMQHHGAPTRLLDFTWSPFVAGFFALERATNAAAVWGLFFSSIFKANDKLLRPDGDARQNQRLIEDFPQEQEPTRRFFDAHTGPVVFPGEPKVMNQRLIAQSGTFVLPGVIDQPLEKVVLGTYPNPKRTVVKFVLDTAKIREEAMHALYSMNITNATLFPGLDGLARSLAYELESHWAFDPKTMKQYTGFVRQRAI